MGKANERTNKLLCAVKKTSTGTRLANRAVFKFQVDVNSLQISVKSGWRRQRQSDLVAGQWFLSCLYTKQLTQPMSD